MKVTDLLTPRFEVIANYPDCPFEIGDILYRIEFATNDWYDINSSSNVAKISLQKLEKYPHLFKKLEWWEKRTDEEMPY